MGCDIHCYLEYKPKNTDNWRDFGGRINPGRHYSLFGAMAGVRYELPHVEPRGVPDDLAYAAFDDWAIYVSDSQKTPTDGSGSDYSYSRERAEEYVAKGWAQWVPRGEHANRFVTNSDWHTPSWLTADEFELAIATYLKAEGFGINTPKLPAPEALATAITEPRANDHSYALRSITEYWAILAALRCFEAQGHEARLIFWFDN